MRHLWPSLEMPDADKNYDAAETHLSAFDFLQVDQDNKGCQQVS